MASNRTILELKREQWGHQQFAEFFQSHHTGIETYARLAISKKVINFQSHHTGIETFSFVAIVIIAFSSNRTILELKQISRTLKEIAMELPIAPYWN